MPFQPINFANIAPQGDPAMRDFVENLATGYKAGQVPAALANQRQSEELANKMKQVLLNQAPEKFKSELEAQKAQAQYNQQRANELVENRKKPFGGKIPSGPVAQAYWLDQYAKEFGPDAPVTLMANKLAEEQRKKDRILNENREALTKSIGKRYSTTISKLEQEENEAKAGFVPGTDRKQKLAENEKQKIIDSIELKRQKEVSDLDTRKRALFASNIDKSLESIDVDALTQYAGIKGGVNKIIETGKALTGKESENLKKYTNALAKAKILQKQIRQFYGDSITPQVQESLEKLVNPASWGNNQALAKETFNSLTSLLKKETGTYRNALKSTKEFESSKNSQPSSNSGVTRVYYQGKPHLIPNDKVDAALNAGGTLNG